MKADYYGQGDQKNPNLDNIHFHHKDKGCQCRFVRVKSMRDVNMENIECLTHGVMCSASGWELGWAGGTDNHKLWRKEGRSGYCKTLIRRFYGVKTTSTEDSGHGAEQVRAVPKNEGREDSNGN